MKRLYFILFLITCLIPIDSWSNHLTGGVITYECISGNTYKFTVSRYRDCAAGGPNISNTPLVIDPIGSGATFTVPLSQVSIANISPPTSNPCLTPPASICYEEYVYQSGNVTIPNSPGGYEVYFQAGNRNGSVTNIVNPSTVGITTIIWIPDPGTYACNSSPNFINFPPTIICLNDTFSFDHSATDPDGDVLSYYLCNAYDDAPNAPPFNVVPYAPKPGGGNYSGTYPIHANPPMTINPVTGVFKGKPILIGNYAVVVCVDEIRNGVVIGTYTREVQINVTTCNANVSAAIQSDPPAAGAAYGSVLSCNNYTVNFANTSTNSNSFFWDFGDPTVTTDTSSSNNPSYVYPDTGIYTAMLVATPGFPCADTAFVYVRVFPGMNANFGISDSLCIGFPIYFTDSSTSAFGTVSGWSWQFGNGTSSNLQNPVNTYPFQSTYFVSLIAEDTKGCRDTITKPITVHGLPQVNAGPDQNICDGDSATLLATSNALSYSWKPSTGLSCTTCLQPKAAPLTNTIYTLVATGQGFCTDSSTVEITIRPAPVVNLGPDLYLCGSTNVQINGNVANAQAGYSVSWSPTSNLIPSIVINPFANPPVTTTYIATVTTLDGCISSDTITIYVNSVSAITGPNQTICSKDTVQLIGSSALQNVTYNWQPVNSISDPSIPNPLAFPQNTTVYTLTVTDTATGCFGTNMVTVTINNPPSVDAGQDLTVCFGNNAVLAPSGGVNYVWDPEPSLSCTGCTGPIASPFSTTKYYVTGYDAAGCENRDSVVITVQPLPIINVSPSSSVICTGQSVNLSASGATNYTWLPNNGLSCINCPNPVASPLTTVTYMVIGTDSYGCENTSSSTVTVTQGTPVNVSGNQIICLGDTAQLNVSGSSSYQWAPAATLTNANIANPRAFPAVNTVYTVTATDANGCLAFDSVSVSVNILQPGNFSPDGSICNGGSYQLFANGFTITNWQTPNNPIDLSCSSCPNPIATPTVTTTYTVHVQDNQGCADSGTVTVSVNPPPIASIDPDISICSGETVIINAGGGNNYTWSPITGLSCVNCPAPIATPISTTRYLVTVSNGNNCSDTASILITVNTLPIINTITQQDICLGDSIQLNTSGANNYTWSPVTGLSCSNCASPMAFPVVSIMYNVTGTDINGCIGRDSVQVNVLQPPLPNIVHVQPICTGDSVQLSVSGGTAYQWNPTSSLSCLNCPDPHAFPINTETYYVRVSNSAGCFADDSIEVIVASPANISISPDTSICPGENVQLNVTGGVSFTWLPNLEINDPNVADPIISPSQNRIYTVRVIDAQGCLIEGSVQIDLHPLISPNAGTDAAICTGDSVILTANNGSTYTWLPSGSLLSPSSLSTYAYPSITTIYTVTIIDVNGCINSDSVSIIVNQNPIVDAGLDQEIYSGKSIQLNGSGVSSYEWNPKTALDNPFSPNPLATPVSTTVFYLTGIDDNGCTGIDSIKVTVNDNPGYNVTTAFTPNNDGRNDIFIIKNAVGITLTSLKVYSRWGGLVYESGDLQVGWDGTYNGTPLPMDSYIYIVHAKDETGKPILSYGNVTLIR